MNLGRYKIIKELGKGSMGVVYQAHDPQIDRLVALKVLRRDRVDGESFVKRFLKDAKAIGRFSHPNIVTVYDVGQDREDIYIAMEFVDGEPLNQIIQQKKLKLDQIIELGLQAAQVLDYAHQKGVIHRDIKPSNIILQPNGQIKIIDFGIAHMEDSSSTLLTMEGEIMGTPAYMSPEQVLGKSVDGRTDIFSLGVVLYELSFGRRPFGGKGKNIATVFNEIIHHSPQEPVFETGMIPQRLSSVVMKCLNKSPEKRFQNGFELAEALKICLKSESGAAVTPHLKQRRRNYAAPVLAALMIVVGAGAFFYFFKYKANIRIERRQQVVPNSITTLPPAEVTKEMKEAPREKPEEKRVEIKDKTGQQTKQQDKVIKRQVVQKASLIVRSTPQGADLIIDDRPKGKTPATVKLSPGTHRIILKLSDYHTWQTQVTLTKAEERPIHAELNPLVKNDEWIIKPVIDRKKEDP